MSEQNFMNERFRFSSQSLAEDTFLVVRFSGTEGFNTLYSFEMTLMSKDSDIALQDLLVNPATFTILRADGKHAFFHGYPSACSQGAHSNGWTFYTLTLQPIFWKLTRIPFNRIDLDLNTQGIVAQAMAADPTFKPEHEFKLLSTYVKQEFSMQYNESLYDYIAAKLERDGIYYYFDQTDSTEKIIFADSQQCHTVLKDSPKLTYSPTSGLEHPYIEEVISSFVKTCTALPKKVYVRDYDWQKPNTPIEAEADVSETGLGDVYYYGEGFITTEEGTRIAKIRAEELICQSKIYLGISHVPTLRPGFIFELEKHYSASFNQEYLITEVTHEGSQEGYLSLALGIQLPHPTDTLFYRNNFKAIPANVQFRPKRSTQRPKISGYLTAFIDSATDSAKPELDELGRYKVVFPQGSSGRGAGKASCWLRRAQASVGAGFGTSFPLTPGVEVLVSFLDGNPDKPLIASAVANAEVGSMDTAATSLLTGISSGGGGALLFNDKDSKQGISLSSGSKRSGTIMSSGSVDSTFTHAETSLHFSSSMDTSLAALAKSSKAGFKDSMSVGGDKGWNSIILSLLTLTNDITKAGSKFDINQNKDDGNIAWDAIAESSKLAHSLLPDMMKIFKSGKITPKSKTAVEKTDWKTSKTYAATISGSTDKSSINLESKITQRKQSTFIAFQVARLAAQLATAGSKIKIEIDEIDERDKNAKEFDAVNKVYVVSKEAKKTQIENDELARFNSMSSEEKGKYEALNKAEEERSTSEQEKVNSMSKKEVEILTKRTYTDVIDKEILLGAKTQVKETTDAAKDLADKTAFDKEYERLRAKKIVEYMNDDGDITQSEINKKLASDPGLKNFKDEGQSVFIARVEAKKKDKKLMTDIFAFAGDVQALVAEFLATVKLFQTRQKFNAKSPNPQFGGIKMVAPEYNIAIASETETRVVSSNQLVLAAQPFSIKKIDDTLASKLAGTYEFSSELGHDYRVLIHGDDVRSIAMNDNTINALDSVKINALGWVEISNAPSSIDSLYTQLQKEFDTITSPTEPTYAAEYLTRNSKFKLIKNKLDERKEKTFSTIAMSQGLFSIYNRGDTIELLQEYLTEDADKSTVTMTRMKKDSDINNQLKFDKDYSKLLYRKDGATKESSITLKDNNITLSAGKAKSANNADFGIVTLTDQGVDISLKNEQKFLLNETEIKFKNTKLGINVTDTLTLEATDTIKVGKSFFKDQSIKLESIEKIEISSIIKIA